MAPRRALVFKILFIVLIAQLFLFMQPIESSARPSDNGKLHQESSSSRKPKKADSRRSCNGPLIRCHQTSLKSYSSHDRSKRQTLGPALEVANDPDQKAQLVAESKDSTEVISVSFRPINITSTVASTSDQREPTANSGAAPSRKSSQEELNPADLCYLSNGGSSLTLAVNEATPVGALIGTVDVTGDPSLEGGNVELSVETSAGHSGEQQPAAAHAASDGQSRRLLGRRDAETVAHHRNLVATSAALARLEPGTRRLLLARHLDKEALEAEQASLSVLVRCRPLLGSRQLASSVIIPIRLLVTDANDHAPEFSAPIYVLNISETTPVGSVATHEIQAADRDATQGPHTTVHYRVLENLLTESRQLQSNAMFAFTNPLEPTLFVAAPLDYETLAQTNQTSFTFAIQAQDEGEPEPLASLAQVQVNIIDFDDQNPRFLDEKYSLLIDEQQASSVGQNLLVLPHQMKAEDGDRGIMAPIVYSFDRYSAFISPPSLLETDEFDELGTNNRQSLGGLPANQTVSDSSIERYLNLNPSTGELSLIRQWPRNRWPQPGLPITLVVRATQADNRDRYALTTLTISSRSSTVSNANIEEKTTEITESDRKLVGLFFDQERLTLEVPENARVNERVATVRASLQPAATRGDRRRASRGTGPHHQHSAGTESQVNYQILDDHSRQFGIDSQGKISLRRELDYEQKQEYKFRVLATKQKYSDICYVQVNVLNVNDNKPKFTQTRYTFQLTEARLRSNSLGFVQAHDADLDDTIRYSLFFSSPQSSNGASKVASESAANEESSNLLRLLEIDPTSGQLSLKRTGALLNVSSCHFHVRATDSLGPEGARHTQLASITLHVAPQIIGRSIDLEQLINQPNGTKSDEAPALTSGSFAVSKLSSGRSRQQARNKDGGYVATLQITDHQATESSNVIQLQPFQTAPNTQRSSLATVMSSFQHMISSRNLLEMPISSVLLLSALVAFLLSLLLIATISASAHFYKRASIKTARRRHLSAAAQLRHHLTGAASRGTSATAISSNSERVHYLPPRSRQMANYAQPLIVAGSHRTQTYSSSPTSQSRVSSESDCATGMQKGTFEEAKICAYSNGTNARAITHGRDTKVDLTVRSPDRPSLYSKDLGPGISNSEPPNLSHAREWSNVSDSDLCTRDISTGNGQVGCGHYSVTNTMELPKLNFSGQVETEASTIRPNFMHDAHIGQSDGLVSECQVKPFTIAARRSIGEAIMSLAHDQKIDAEANNQSRHNFRPSKLKNVGNIKMASRSEFQVRKVAQQMSGGETNVPGDEISVVPYQRIIWSPDELNSRVSSVRESECDTTRLNNRINNDDGLMSLVRNSFSNFSNGAQHEYDLGVRWASNASAQRVKKLTWNDELSVDSGNQCGPTSDCFGAADNYVIQSLAVPL